jgi:hypothetical protein
MQLTPEQQESFNGFQIAGFMHPFTCGTKEKHAPGADEVLVARDDGFYCPSCDYKQTWAHAWMLDGSWRETLKNWGIGLFGNTAVEKADGWAVMGERGA